MKRDAFALRLKPGCAEEYKKHHDAIWPELKAELRKAGISDYSIYLDEKTNTLFGFRYLADDNTKNELFQKDIVKKWGQLMKDILETNPDGSPGSEPLKEMFHMD